MSVTTGSGEGAGGVVGHIDPTAPPTADEVRLDVPARPRSLRLLRLAAADAAAEVGLDIDGVESARIAIDELSALLLATGEWTRIVLRLRTGAGSLAAHGEVIGARGSTRAIEVDRVVQELLGMCVDHYELLDGPAFRFTLSAAPRRDG